MAEAVNTFGNGMNRDIPDMQMPNNAYTVALNATLITNDGNELIMLNDMGNAKIYYTDSGTNKEVTLSQGFIPIGVKTYGEILYIVSAKKESDTLYIGEIGTFPSPNYSISEGSLKYIYRPLHNAYINSEEGLIDFRSEYFNFDFSHPVSIEIQPSYDGSVNLLLTDNKNKPRLINSGFSVQEGNTYKIIKHIGNNNTNVYNISSEIKFLLETALQKQSYQLPKIQFTGLNSGGLLKTGGYVIYIKASDEDGNTTDIIAESGVIPVFLGTDGSPKSVNGGYADMRTDKSIKLTVSNIDTSYNYIKVFYSRTTSAINESANTLCYELADLYPVINGVANIIITGFEQTMDISDTELNTQYVIIDKNRAAVNLSNYTFIGNVKTASFDYETLRTLSLHIYPNLVESLFSALKNPNTLESLKKISVDTFEGLGYSSSENVYYFTGYHNEELYRFGIVYIYSDGSTSPVFNTLGINELSQNGLSTSIKNVLKDSSSLITNYEQLEDYISKIGNITIPTTENYPILNRRGVCRIMGSTWDPQMIYGILFIIPLQIKTLLENCGIIGYFFVRQKRIPLKLLLGYTVPIFENTFTPAIKYGPRFEALTYYNPKGGNFSNEEGFAKPYLKKNFYKTNLFSTYLTETFYWNVFDKTARDFCCPNACKKLYKVHFPEIGTYKRSRAGHIYADDDDTTKPGNMWKLTLDYNERLLPMCLQGLVYSKHTNTDASNSNNNSYVNGKNATYDGKYPGVRGRLPLTSLLERGAYACFSPEFELDLPYYNAFFTGLEFNIKVIKYENITNSHNSLKRSHSSERVYYDALTNYNTYQDNLKVKLISVADSVSLLGILRDHNDTYKESKTTTYNENWKYRDTVYFSSKVGDATDKLGYKEVGGERVSTYSPLVNNVSAYYDSDGTQISLTNVLATDSSNNDDENNGDWESITTWDEDEWRGYPYPILARPANLIRGLYSPYIGLYISNELLLKYHSGTEPKDDTIRTSLLENAVINIYIPGFSEDNISQYRLVCFLDNDNYYAISDRYTLEETLPICYRGDCYCSVTSHRINRNFLDPAAPSNDTIVSDDGFNHYLDGLNTKTCNYYGDSADVNSDGEKRTSLPVSSEVTATNLDKEVNNDKSSVRVATTNLGDLNAIQLGSWISFLLSTTMNIALRSEDRSWATEKLLMGQYRSFYPLYGVNIGGSGKLPDSTVYNKGFSISGGVKLYTLNDNESYDNIYFKNRIYYSNISTNNAIINGTRTILANCKLDYDSKYGSIVKLLNYSSNLLCIMEHGCALIAVQPRAVLSGTTNSFINTTNILDDRLTQVLSDSYGSTWEESIISTPHGIYGIDTFAKKIWAIIGGQFTLISDGNIASFLNDNLNITNDSLKIGEVKIKTHYNMGKKDVIFTCYQYKEEDNENVLWSVCYNENLLKWTTFYSWIPEQSENIGNTFLTFDHKNCKKLLTSTSEYVNIWKHGPSNFIPNTDRILPTTWYGSTLPFEIEFIVAQSQENAKLFTNLQILSNKAEPESFHYLIVGLCYENSIDKPTQYYRLERTNELWHKSGSDISFDPYYKDFNILLRPLWHYENSLLKVSNENIYVKSLVPWNYYVKTHNTSDIEDYYKQATADSKDYNYLTGTELVKDKRLLDLCIQTHAKGVNIDGPAGVLRGNMKYMEDIWYVQINPIQYKEKNESLWIYPPIVFNNSPIPEDIDETKLDLAAINMNLTTLDFDFTDWGERKSFKLKDKYIKIRIRYSGKDKVILQAIKTLYQISYS